MPSHTSKSTFFRKHASFEKLKKFWKTCNAKEPDKKAAGVDKVTPKKFKEHLDQNLRNISDQLVSGEYKFQKLVMSPIPKGDGKCRIICIPTVKDRLVQRLILNLLINRKDGFGVKNEISFGSIEGQGIRKAIKKAIELRIKCPWALKTDITAFFDKIDRQQLMCLIKKKLKNPSLIFLLEKIVNAEILTKTPEEKEILKENGITEGKGLRQGMPLSPLLSNVFLESFDKLTIKEKLNIIRYVDDIVVFCQTKEECIKQKEIIENALNKIKLSIPSLCEINSKTEIKAPDEPIIFLGVEIYKESEGKYSQRIPKSSRNKIFSELKAYADYKYVLNKQLNYASLARTLDSKLSGYKGAFNDTINFNQFREKFEREKEEIKIALLKQVLGEKVFNFLTDEKRKFLGILTKKANKLRQPSHQTVRKHQLSSTRKAIKTNPSMETVG